MHKVPADKAATAEALKFFGWAFDKGGKMAEELDYVPMPANVVELIKKTWSADVKAIVIRAWGKGVRSLSPATFAPAMCSVRVIAGPEMCRT